MKSVFKSARMGDKYVIIDEYKNTTYNAMFLWRLQSDANKILIAIENWGIAIYDNNGEYVSTEMHYEGKSRWLYKSHCVKLSVYKQQENNEKTVSKEV